MPDSASRSNSQLSPEDRPIHQSNLYLKIATQLQHFFEWDLTNFPLEIEGKILRVQVPIDNKDQDRSIRLSPLNWLARQSTDVKIYWSDREEKFTMAGVGQLSIISGDVAIDYPTVFADLRQDLSPHFPQVRYYGGIGFTQDRSISHPANSAEDSTWELFGNYRFIIPEFEVCTNGVETHFACNFQLDSSIAIDRQLDRLLTKLATLDLSTDREIVLPDLQLSIDRVDTPNAIEWHQNISTALTTFPHLNLDKIVLARRSILTFTAPLQPQSILLALQPHNPRSYHFCFQINPQTAFIGTSPERLYHRHDRFLKTEAVAGTRHRGTSVELDRELSDALRTSTKDLHEHQLVVNNLAGILDELCETVSIEPRSTILKLNKVQHLYTQFQGILKVDLTDAEILPKLHPTPAVGGFPRIPALQLIRKLEPFERGWYAAPVGWVGYDDAEFAVAIRSGLIDGDKLLLFAGAGIVKGSQSDEEWIEVENKIRHFTDLFQLPDFADRSAI
jgi:menaquinone-specific isochorismate synthase